MVLVADSVDQKTRLADLAVNLVISLFRIFLGVGRNIEVMGFCIYFLINFILLIVAVCILDARGEI